MNKNIRELILSFEKIGMLNFGSFTFKSGIKSPIYVNMRILISYPKVMKQVAKVYSQLLENVEYDRLGGIPYAGLPITEAISLEREEPWVFYRKEAKKYGLGKIVEGEFEEGETVVVIDELVSKGDSKFDAVAPFEAAGFKIKDFVVLMNYGFGAEKVLADKGYALHYAFTMHDVIDVLLVEKRIGQTVYDAVVTFIAENQI
jgi:orotate phosphoribosyltransferase